MPTSIYIGSTTGYAGKNMLAIGLGLILQREGYKVGYMKPVGTLPKLYEDDNKMGDEDAFFVQEALGLKEDLELVTPVLITHDLRMQVFSEGCPDMLGEIKDAYETLSRDKDVMLICGSGSFLHSGKVCHAAGIDIVQELDSRVILVDRFFNEFYYDYILSAHEHLGDKMLGFILNSVPESRMENVNELLIPLLEDRGIHHLGTIKEDPILNSITIGDLSRSLGGKIITGLNQERKMIQNFLIGTMQVENFMTYFKKNKDAAIIVGGDRSDLQLVALEGKCPCLILTGNLYPNDIILTRAEALEIPIITVRDDTYTVAKNMENILSSIKVRDDFKILHGEKLIQSHLDLGTIKKSIA